MTYKSVIKWFLHSMVGAAALLGFMIIGYHVFLVPVIVARLLFPSSVVANTPFLMPLMMQIGGAVGIAIAAFLAYRKRLLSVPQLLVSLVVYDLMVIVYHVLVFCSRARESCAPMLSVDSLLRFNSLTTLPWLIGVAAAVVLRALRKGG